MDTLRCSVTFLILIVLQLFRCDAVTEIEAHRLVNYDGQSCRPTDVVLHETDLRSRVECVTRCSQLSQCASVFYKQDFCQGCRHFCHHNVTLPALTETTYYCKRTAFSFHPGVISYGCNFYLIVENANTWQGAQNHCRSLQAELIYIESVAELDWIAAQLGSFHYWSGGILSSGQFVWSHNGAPINMTLFGPGQPDGNGFCVGFLSSGYRLDDYGCSVMEGFICKSI